MASIERLHQLRQVVQDVAGLDIGRRTGDRHDDDVADGFQFEVGVIRAIINPISLLDALLNN